MWLYFLQGSVVDSSFSCTRTNLEQLLKFHQHLLPEPWLLNSETGCVFSLINSVIPHDYKQVLKSHKDSVPLWIRCNNPSVVKKTWTEIHTSNQGTQQFGFCMFYAKTWTITDIYKEENEKHGRKFEKLCVQLNTQFLIFWELELKNVSC